MKCPRCGGEIIDSGQKWTYRNYDVSKFICKSCEKAVNLYFLQKELVYIIPSSPLAIARSKVRRYLHYHREASEEEIADKLKLPVKTIKDILIELENKGIVERIS